MKTCEKNFEKLQNQLIQEHNQKLDAEKTKYLSIIQQLETKIISFEELAKSLNKVQETNTQKIKEQIKEQVDNLSLENGRQIAEQSKKIETCIEQKMISVIELPPVEMRVEIPI